MAFGQLGVLHSLLVVAGKNFSIQFLHVLFPFFSSLMGEFTRRLRLNNRTLLFFSQPLVLVTEGQRNHGQQK